MSQIERKLPSGIHVIERYTRPYIRVILTTSTTEFTAESVSGGEPNSPHTFEIDLSTGLFPSGHKFRAVYVDVLSQWLLNTNVTNNYIGHGGSPEEADFDVPWMVKKGAGGTFVPAGYFRLGSYPKVATQIESAYVVQHGHIDVKGTFSGPDSSYRFKLGDNVAGPPSQYMRSNANDLHIGGIRFRVRFEML